MNHMNDVIIDLLIELLSFKLIKNSIVDKYDNDNDEMLDLLCSE